MPQLTTTTDPARFIGCYGPEWRQSLISDHLDLFIRAGGVHHPSKSIGAGWAVIDGTAYPIVCSEVVKIYTEDGAWSGRCGANALDATGTCHWHDPR